MNRCYLRGRPAGCLLMWVSVQVDLRRAEHEADPLLGSEALDLALGRLWRVEAVGHRGDVSLRGLALVDALHRAANRDCVLGIVDGQVGAAVALEVGRPAPAAARIDDDLVTAQQEPDDDLMGRAIAVDRRQRRVAWRYGRQEGARLLAQKPWLGVNDHAPMVRDDARRQANRSPALTAIASRLSGGASGQFHLAS